MRGSGLGADMDILGAGTDEDDEAHAEADSNATGTSKAEICRPASRQAGRRENHSNFMIDLFERWERRVEERRDRSITGGSCWLSKLAA